jgi:hypothetical protein
MKKEEQSNNDMNKILWISNNLQCKQIESCYNSLSKKCICPKEEPKQETLEEAAEHNYPGGDVWTEEQAVIRRLAFKNGAKYQAERMYSEEDMAESFVACWKSNVPDGIECKLSFKEWFKQFKKK